MIKSKRGGVLTAVVGLIIFLLVLVSRVVPNSHPLRTLVAETLSLAVPLVRMIWASTYTAHRIMRFKWIQMSKRIFS